MDQTTTRLSSPIDRPVSLPVHIKHKLDRMTCRQRPSIAERTLEGAAVPMRRETVSGEILIIVEVGVLQMFSSETESCRSQNPEGIRCRTGMPTQIRTSCGGVRSSDDMTGSGDIDHPQLDGPLTIVADDRQLDLISDAGLLESGGKLRDGPYPPPIHHRNNVPKPAAPSI